LNNENSKLHTRSSLFTNKINNTHWLVYKGLMTFFLSVIDTIFLETQKHVDLIYVVVDEIGVLK